MKLFFRDYGGYLLVLPACIVMALFVLYPLGQGLFSSFTDKHLLRPEASLIGLENYQRLLHDLKFWEAFGRSLWLTALVVPLEYLLGLGFALLLNRRVRLTLAVRRVALMSWVLPLISQVMLFRWMLAADYGIVNIVSRELGFASHAWLADPTTALGVIAVMHIWRNLPFFGVTLLAGMQSVPPELYEAATVDGASAWGCFRYITLPHLRRISMVVIIGHVAFTFNDYVMVAAATGGGPVSATELLPVYLYTQAWHHFELGYASAIGTVMLLAFFCFALPYIWLQERKGIL